MYTIVTAIKSLIRSKFVNLTVILSLSLGLLLPMLALCIGNVVIQSLWNGIVYNPERVIAIMCQEGARVDVKQAIADHPEIELIHEAAFVESDFAVCGDKFIKATVSPDAAGANKIARFYMISGSFYTDEEADGTEPICVISHRLQKDLDCKVGDSITMSGIAYTLKGVYADDSPVIRIPLEIFSSVYRTAYTYDIQLKKGYDASVEGVEAVNAIYDEYGITTRDYLLATAYYDESNRLKNAVTGISIMLAIAGVVLLYAALNISNILVNKIHSDMKNYTIKMQLGASKGKLFGFLAVQLLLLMLISVGIDMTVTAVLHHFMPYIATFPFSLNSLVVILTVGIGSVYILILSWMLIRRIYRKETAR